MPKIETDQDSPKSGANKESQNSSRARSFLEIPPLQQVQHNHFPHSVNMRSEVSEEYQVGKNVFRISEHSRPEHSHSLAPALDLRELDNQEKLHEVHTTSNTYESQGRPSSNPKRSSKLVDRNVGDSDPVEEKLRKEKKLTYENQERSFTEHNTPQLSRPTVFSIPSLKDSKINSKPNPLSTKIQVLIKGVESSAKTLQMSKNTGQTRSSAKLDQINQIFKKTAGTTIRTPLTPETISLLHRKTASRLSDDQSFNPSSPEILQKRKDVTKGMKMLTLATGGSALTTDRLFLHERGLNSERVSASSRFDTQSNEHVFQMNNSSHSNTADCHLGNNK